MCYRVVTGFFFLAAAPGVGAADTIGRARRPITVRWKNRFFFCRAPIGRTADQLGAAAFRFFPFVVVVAVTQFCFRSRPSSLVLLSTFFLLAATLEFYNSSVRF